MQSASFQGFIIRMTLCKPEYSEAEEHVHVNLVVVVVGGGGDNGAVNQKCRLA